MYLKGTSRTILYMRKKKPEVSYLFLEVYYAILQN